LLAAQSVGRDLKGLLWLAIAVTTIAGGTVLAVTAGRDLSVVNVRSFLDLCSGGRDIDVCATQAAQQAVSRGVSLYFPTGTYFLSNWAPPCPLRVFGDGMGKTILSRPAAAAGSVVYAQKCGGLSIEDLSVDGNKSNNTAIGYTVVLSNSWNFSLARVEIRNSKGAGSALTVMSGLDDSKKTHSVLYLLDVHDNDGNGVFFQNMAANWTLGKSTIRSNGGAGVSVIDYEFPPTNGRFSGCVIADSDISYNQGGGMSLTSGFIGGTSAKPVNGPFRTIENCRISGNQVNHNGGYGILMAGGYNIAIVGNVASNNGTGKSSGVAGINSALCEECYVTNNVTRFNDFYGIDAGGAVHTRIQKNVVSNNGNATINNGTGISCGACEDVDILDNVIESNGWSAGGAQVYVTTYDAGVSGFSLPAKNIVVKRNRVVCGNDRQLGVLVLSDPPNMTVEGNRAEKCAILQGYVLQVTNGVVRGNQQDNWIDGVAVAPSIDNPVYPDGVDTLIPAAAFRVGISALWPEFYSANYQTVYAVVMQNGGSNYSPLATVRFEGGGCARPPEGFVFNDNAGHVVGVRLTNYGSHCTKPPVVSFRDTTGSGAAAAAYVLTSIPNNGRRLRFRGEPEIGAIGKANHWDLLGGAGFAATRRGLNY
jgi:parallel beta-helix repeat protein